MPELIPNGPAIPVRLLNELDSGNVVFFCGAGISAACGSDLPDFGELVRHVYEVNHIKPDAAEKSACENGNWDKALGLLERRLNAGFLRGEVIKRLSKPPSGDLKVHKALIDLSRDDRGVRLVTTNFDNRFVEAGLDETLVDVAPRLPIPKPHAWSSLVHLHGRIAPKEDGSNLVLTAADFGCAYLTERWAARFVTDLFRHFSVIFVGYSLSDPVMGYMVDALAAERSRGALFGTAWAFAATDNSDDVGKSKVRNDWRTKSVEPILYDKRDGHRLLVKTLIAWARVRKDPVQTRSQIALNEINRMPDGPDDPIVARVVWALQDSSAAKALAESPPIENEDDYGKFAKWLNMLTDAGLLRFTADKIGSDAPDQKSVGALQVDVGCESINPRNLDTIRWHLSAWLARHLHVPHLFAWVLRNGGHLHSYFRQQVKRSLATQDSMTPDIPGRLRLLWTVLLSGKPDDPRDVLWDSEHYKAGTPDERRLIEDKAIESIRPRLIVRPGPSLDQKLRMIYEKKPQALQPIDECGHLELMSGSGDIWRCCEAILENSEVLSRYAETLTGYLEHALSLDVDYSNVRWSSFLERPSIAPNEQNDYHDRRTRLTRLIDLARDSHLALISTERGCAHNLLLRWVESKEPLLRRLALHALTENPGSDIRLARKLLLTGRNPGLWDRNMRRETMRFLRLAGKRLPQNLRIDIVKAIHAGPKSKKVRSSFGQDGGWRKEQALLLYKMCMSGVKLNKASMEIIEAITPEMKEITQERDEFLIWGEGGPASIRVGDCAPKRLVGGSVDDIMAALDPEQVDSDAFQGLIVRKPIKVVSALRRLGKQGSWPAKYWREFLWHLADPKCRARLRIPAARVLAKAPAELFNETPSAVASFVNQLADACGTDRENEFGLLWTKSWNEKEGSGGETDDMEWATALTRAVNHPAGKLAEAAMARLSKYEPRAGVGIAEPVRSYFDVIAEDPAGHPGRMILATRLYRLFAIDPEWTKRHLIERLSTVESQEAVDLWSAYIWSSRLGPDLLNAIKTPFLEILCDGKLEDLEDRGLSLFMAVCLETPGALTEREIRTVIDPMSEKGLLTLLRNLQRRLTAMPDERRQIWCQKLYPWLNDYWPRERARNTVKTSEAILTMLAECGDAFPQATEWSLAHLQPVEGEGLYFLHRNGCAKRYPTSVFKVLDKAIGAGSLKDNYRYILQELLDTLCTEDSELARNSRFQDLRRIATQ